MGAPPPEDAGSTKSRELYGNRVAALGKGRPTAPGNPGHRVVTSPAAPLASPSSRTSPDENAAKSAAHLTPNSIGQSVSSSISLSCRSSSGLTDRPVSLLDVADGSDEAPGTSVQLSASPQLEPSTGPQSATSKPTVSAGHYSLPVSSSSSTSLVVTTVPRGDVSSPPRATSSEGTATPVGSTPTLITYEESPAHAELCTQDYPPIATPKSAVSTVQVHIPSEQVPAKEATISANLWGFRLDRPPQNGTPAILSLHSDTSSVTQPPSSSLTSSADILKEESTSSTSDAPILNQIKSGLPPHSSPTSASTITFPSTISSTVPSVSEDFDDSITMSSPPVAEPGRRSFSAVVHRGGDGDGDNRSNSSHSTISNSSTIIPRPSSSSSFKTGTDGGVVRSKRNFKHLGAVAADPPPSPGAGDLAALLQEAAWLEQQLSNENTTLTVPYALGEDGQKAEKSAPLPAAATKAGQAIVPAPMVATSTRTKGRGLTLGSSISASPSNTLQSPVQSSPSTPSFQIHADALPTPPKSTRGRKYFSLRGAFRGPRLSVSSEMSSDDSAAIATPPSPSFDLAMQQTVQGHSNDSMSIRTSQGRALLRSAS
ncbi:hypothetical protein BJV74DRAFT_7553 [Russula compacta]|nr:hypothetical protein BJV74DRAFT_7553 [Russula compacta]